MKSTKKLAHMPWVIGALACVTFAALSTPPANAATTAITMSVDGGKCNINLMIPGTRTTGGNLQTYSTSKVTCSGVSGLSFKDHIQQNNAAGWTNVGTAGSATIPNGPAGAEATAYFTCSDTYQNEYRVTVQIYDGSTPTVLAISDPNFIYCS